MIRLNVDKTSELMRKYRKENRYTFKALSEITGFASPTLRSYEQGRTAPKVEVLIALSRIYGCTVEDLVAVDD